jgi:hypothetical protein
VSENDGAPRGEGAAPPPARTPSLRWWEATTAGTPKLLAFVKLDRAGSTREWSELPEDEAFGRRRAYVGGIEYIAGQFDAAQPLHFQGDGVMLFLADADEPAPLRAVRAARLLWERVRIELNLAVRIAVHAAEVPWERDTGRLASPAIDACGHLEHATPENGVAITEDVYLALPDSLRREFAPLGVTVRDGTAAYVRPASLAPRRSPAHFRESPDLDLWAAFRRYALSAEVARLRYVGLRLARREPPSLDVRDVFVPPTVQARVALPLTSEALAELAQGTSADTPEAPTPEPAPTKAAVPPDLTALAATLWARLAVHGASTAVSLGEALTRHRALVVLGETGAGKTTLLRWLAVTVCSGPLGAGRQMGLRERLLPLPVSVGRLADVRRTLGRGASVVEALARYFHDRSVAEEALLKQFLRARLDAGDVLVLLDGLDEVRRDERTGLRGWLESFAAQHPRNRYVATARSVGYDGFALPEGTEIALQPFDDEQVRRYVVAFQREYLKWETGQEDPVVAAQQSASLHEALLVQPRLQSLARNPFLLSGMALIHRAEGRLPRHRVQVYEVFARALCETWSSARRLVAGDTRPDFSYEGEALPILGHLALRMHENWPTGSAPEPFVIEALAEALQKRQAVGADEARQAAREFLDRAGRDVQILLERGAGQWGFPHLTFQEFFVAAGLHASETFEKVALKHLFDPRWEEVIRLGVGYMAIIQHRDEAVRRFIDKVRKTRLRGKRAWITDVLRKQVALAALFVADAGDALAANERRSMQEEFADWAQEVAPDAIEALLHELPRNMLNPLVERLKSWWRSDDALLRGRALNWEIELPGGSPGWIPTAAVRGVASFGAGTLPAEHVSQVLDWLAGRDARFREAATRLLAGCPADVAVPKAVELTQDPLLRDAALAALWQIALR